MTSLDDVIDPVCGMTMPKKAAPLVREHDQETFYLCSVECGAKFDRDADAYVAAAKLKLPWMGKNSASRERREAVPENRRRVSSVIGGEFGGEFLPANYDIDVGKLRHRRPVSL